MAVTVSTRNLSVPHVHERPTQLWPGERSACRVDWRRHHAGGWQFGARDCPPPRRDQAGDWAGQASLPGGSRKSIRIRHLPHRTAASGRAHLLGIFSASGTGGCRASCAGFLGSRSRANRKRPWAGRGQASRQDRRARRSTASGESAACRALPSTRGDDRLVNAAGGEVARGCRQDGVRSGRSCSAALRPVCQLALRDPGVAALGSQENARPYVGHFRGLEGVQLCSGRSTG
jgi:hypothetical protein